MSQFDPLSSPGTRVDIRQLKGLPVVVKLARTGQFLWRSWFPWACSFARPTLVSWLVVAAALGLALLMGGGLGVAVFLVGLGSAPVVWVWLARSGWESQVGTDGQAGSPLARSVEAWFRYRFPAECANAGLVETVRARLRTPNLESVSVDGAWLDPQRLHVGRWSVPRLPRLVVGMVSMNIRPLAQHKPDQWPEVVRRLGVRWDFAASSVEPAANRLLARFTSRELASYAPFDPEAWRAEVDAGRVPFGESGHVGVEVLSRNPDRAIHGLITGTSGGGKSTPLRLLALSYLAMGARLIVINGKRSAEFTWLSKAGLASVANTPAGHWAAIMWFAAESARRQDLLEQSGVEFWQQHPEFGHRNVLMIDEIARVAGAIGVHPEPRLAAESTLALADIAATVRSTGAHLEAATQYGVAQVFGDQKVGSLTRFNLAARIVVGASSRDGLKVAFDVSEEIDHDIATFLGGKYPGRCLYRGLGNDESHLISKGQIWNLSQTEALTMAPSEPPVAPIDFDRMGLEILAAFDAVRTTGTGKTTQLVIETPPPHLAGLNLQGYGDALRAGGRGRPPLSPFVPWLELGRAFTVPAAGVDPETGELTTTTTEGVWS